MFTKHKKFAAIVSLLGAIILFLSFTSTVDAQGMHHNNCKDGMSRNNSQWNDNVPQKYQLSDNQITKISEIRSDYDDQVFPLQRELRALRIETRGYESRTDAEIEKIKSYRNDINKLSNEIDDLRLNERAEINKVLTKEQLAYFGNNIVGDMGSGDMGNCKMDHSRSGMDGCSMMSHHNM